MKTALLWAAEIAGIALVAVAAGLIDIAFGAAVVGLYLVAAANSQDG